MPSFTPPPGQQAEHKADLVFVGSMDWLPNIDGCNYFVRDILPIIRKKRPDCTVGIVGRSPGSGILEMAREDAKILVSVRFRIFVPIFGGARFRLFHCELVAGQG